MSHRAYDGKAWGLAMDTSQRLGGPFRKTKRALGVHHERKETASIPERFFLLNYLRNLESTVQAIHYKMDTLISKELRTLIMLKED